jgi:hypothetical protein
MAREAAAIDARRWAAVRELLDDGESCLANTPAQFMEVDGATWEGVLYLTNRALVGSVAGGVRPYRWKLSFDVIARFEVRSRRLGVIGPEDDVHVMELYPSPLSDQLISRFVGFMKQPG